MPGTGAERSMHVFFLSHVVEIRFIFLYGTQLSQKWLNAGFLRGDMQMVFQYDFNCCELFSGHKREELCRSYETRQPAVSGGQPRAQWAQSGALRPALRWRHGTCRTSVSVTWEGRAVVPSLFGLCVCEALPQRGCRTWLPLVLSSVGITLPPCGFWGQLPHLRLPRTARPHAQACSPSPAQGSLGVVDGGSGAGRRSVRWEIGPARGSSLSL